jgi:Xaa-Pro aminopeptidase
VGRRGKQTGIEGGGLGFYFVESIRDTTKVDPLDDQIELIRLEKDDEELASIRRANRILNSAFETARLAIEDKRCSIRRVALCGTGTKLGVPVSKPDSIVRKCITEE